MFLVKNYQINSLLYPFIIYYLTLFQTLKHLCNISNLINLQCTKNVLNFRYRSDVRSPHRFQSRRRVFEPITVQNVCHTVQGDFLSPSNSNIGKRMSPDVRIL